VHKFAYLSRVVTNTSGIRKMWKYIFLIPIQLNLSIMDCYGDIYCNKGEHLQEGHQVCSSIWVQNMERCKDKTNTHNLSTFINRSLRKMFQIVWSNIIIMKKCGGMHKKNQWQCTLNCRNGSEWDIDWGRIPLPHSNRLTSVNCQKEM
jgi:hypothetical protein